VIVCEGYTDVIGFHRAGLPTGVATCGTALTEEHVRTMKRFATNVVLAFDADKAGQGAAARFYEWEEKYQVQVKVARFPTARIPVT
jgi:DNA primase